MRPEARGGGVGLGVLLGVDFECRFGLFCRRVMEVVCFGGAKPGPGTLMLFWFIFDLFLI